MDIALISSKQDLASLNIRERLLESYEFKKYSKKFNNNEIFVCRKQKFRLYLFLINERLIYAENIDKEIENILNKKIALAIFLSRHFSKEKTPSFTVHSIGNFGKAEFGGRDETLCPASALFLKYFFIELNNNVNNNEKIKEKYEVTIEATHHGPLTDVPSVFVEIGSTEEEWNNKGNGTIIAKTLMNTIDKIKNNKKNNYKTAIGFGGTHYCNNFNKIMIKTNVAFSHICPKYMLEKLDSGLISQSIEKTKEKVELAVLDWKGLGKEKQKVIKLLEELNLEYKRSDHLLKDSGGTK